MFSIRVFKTRLVRVSSSFAGSSTTLVGRSGRVYTRGRLLQAHPSKPELKIHMARCEGRPFVLKPTLASSFKLSQELRHEFEHDRRIRTHIDENEDEQILFYEYFSGDLLSMVMLNADLGFKARKHILKEVGGALQTIHSKNWIHTDLKPNNIMLDWGRDQNGKFQIGRIALCDLDGALKSEGERLIDRQVGNVMWRSLEAQAGKGIGKPSEVFSFGLLCLFTIIGVETLHPDFEKLKENGTEPEHVISYKLLSMFGPAPPSLLTHTNDEWWSDLLAQLSEAQAEDDMSLHFANWEETIFPNLNQKNKDMILRIMKLDPKLRPTMDQVMEDPWWN